MPPFWYSCLHHACFETDPPIQEWMSERSIQIQTQGHLDASTTTISSSNIGLTTGPGDPGPKPRFADFACSYAEVRLQTMPCGLYSNCVDQVFQYVVVVVKAVIPKSFWGSRKNFQVVTKCRRVRYPCTFHPTLIMPRYQGFYHWTPL